MSQEEAVGVVVNGFVKDVRSNCRWSLRWKRRSDFDLAGRQRGMMSAYWFKPKESGYGNVPSTWQGWVLTGGFAAFVIAMAVAVELEALSKFWCVVIVVAVTAGFLALAKAKTDGEWRWR